MSDAQTTTQQSGRQAAVAALARRIDRWDETDHGAHAELRRGKPDDVARPALWRLLVNVVEPAGVAIPTDDEPRWAMLAWAIAHLGAGSKQRFGAALFSAVGSDLRLTRLLEARQGQLPGALAAVVRQMAAKGESADPQEIARFVLEDPDTEAGDRIRRDIARAYYRAEGNRSSKKPANATDASQGDTP